MNRIAARVLRRIFPRIYISTWWLPLEHYMHVLDGACEQELKHIHMRLLSLPQSKCGPGSVLRPGAMSL